MRVIGCSRKPVDIQHDSYRHFELDITDEKAVKKMFSAIRKDFGQLDILLNNAGIASMNSFLLTPVETVRKIFETNVIGAFLFMREAAKAMSTKRNGRIVNFTTIAVTMHLEGEAAYVASKAAVTSFTQIAAREFADFGITVNAVGPTVIRTDLIKGVPDKKLEGLLRRQAISRFGTFEDVVNIVDFFIRPESAFVTGQIVYLGGG